MLSADDLVPFENKLLGFVSVSRKGTYICHVGRYRPGSAYGARVKVTGSSNRYKTADEAFTELEEGSVELIEPVHIFYGVVRETNMWYKLEDIIVSDRMLKQLTQQVQEGISDAIEVHHDQRLRPGDLQRPMDPLEPGV